MSKARAISPQQIADRLVELIEEGEGATRLARHIAYNTGQLENTVFKRLNRMKEDPGNVTIATLCDVLAMLGAHITIGRGNHEC